MSTGPEHTGSELGGLPGIAPVSDAPLHRPSGAAVTGQRPSEAAAPKSRPAPTRLVLVTALFALFVIWSNSFHAIAVFRTRLHVPAAALVTLRYGPVAPFCIAWCLIRRREFLALMRRDGWRVLAMGILMVPGYNLALNWGQGRVPPATASLIIALNPVFTFLFAVALLHERVRWEKIAGLAIAFTGVYLLVQTQQRTAGGGYLLSAIVVMAAPLSWALATVTGKGPAERSDPLLLTFAATGIGSLPFLGTLLAGTGGVHATLAHLPPVGWISLIHLSVLCTIVGFAVFFWALRFLQASTVAAFVFLNPPLTALFGAIWGTERFHWTTAAFGSIVLAGVSLSAGLWRKAR